MKGLATIRALLAPLAVMFGLLFAPALHAQIAEGDRSIALDDAFARLKAASTPEAAERAEQEVWALWNIGPNREATSALAEASTILRRGRYDDAHALLDALLEQEPDYVEAWNQRAFAKFLKGDVYASLADIDQVLKREPRHFGALAGRARIEVQIGRAERAMKTMGEVGAVHPWMARRSAIPPSPPPPEPGEEL
ncbi:MAG: tetratricopeptide repeat protein [Pseudomonadota bacterium]